MSRRSVVAGLSLAGIFSLAFALMWRAHYSAGSPTPSPEVPAIAGDNANPGAAGVPTVARGTPRTRAPESVSAAPAAATDAAATTSVENDSGMAELPVEIHFRHRPDQARIQGSVVNASADELVIEAVVYSPGTRQTQKFQLLVAPHAGKPFGLDGELDMHSGDQITLKSSPYRDKVARIP